MLSIFKRFKNIFLTFSMGYIFSGSFVFQSGCGIESSDIGYYSQAVEEPWIDRSSHPSQIPKDSKDFMSVLKLLDGAQFELDPCAAWTTFSNIKKDVKSVLAKNGYSDELTLGDLFVAKRGELKEGLPQKLANMLEKKLPIQGGDACRIQQIIKLRAMPTRPVSVNPLDVPLDPNAIFPGQTCNTLKNDLAKVWGELLPAVKQSEDWVKNLQFAWPNIYVARKDSTSSDEKTITLDILRRPASTLLDDLFRDIARLHRDVRMKAGKKWNKG